MDLINVKKILDEYALKAKSLILNKLTEKNKIASGDLITSIKTYVDGYTVYLNTLDYLKYIETGTKPHWPPTESILKWVKDKKLPTKELTGDKNLPSEKQLTYLVSRKISLVGTEPTPIIAETIEELNELYMPLLVDALKEDIKKYIPIIKFSFQ